MNNNRIYGPIDHLIMAFDSFISASNHQDTTFNRANPGDSCPDNDLADQDRKISAALMRVNHAGEVAAQALYQGQSVSARSPRVREMLLQLAEEEVDHLLWCQQRLDELGSHTSYLGPVWYGGSFSIGILAGMNGDDWNLGFVAETERQVVRHLQSHLHRLPEPDLKSRAILEQMRADEDKHASNAMQQGAKELPKTVKKLMTLCSKIMTKTAYWI